MALRVAFQTAMRAAAVEMLEDFKADVGINLQIYPGRPRSIHPPTAFVDSIDETLVSRLVNLRERHPQVQVLVLHGNFDSADTVAQRDAFVDGFLDWCADNYHAAGATTLLEPVATVDIPNYAPDWLGPSDRPTVIYYATQITLEGYVQG